MKPSGASDIVIIDETEPCPYLEGKLARMPLRMPAAQITRAQADVRLSLGHRRTGEFVYETRCPACQACEPIRIPVKNYRFSRNQKRVLKRCDSEFSCRQRPLAADAQRVDLFNRHRQLRGLAKSDSDIDREEYLWGFVRSCFDSFEFSYWQGDQLACVAVCDTGQTSLSAVYTFYDPDLADFGLGTYSLLNQIRFCQDEGYEYLYLGYFIQDSPHMNYKSRFRPHQRLIRGEWRDFA